MSTKSAQNTWGGHRCNRCPPSVFMIFEIEDTFTKSCGYLQRAVLPESPAVLQGLWSAHLLPDTGSGIGSETSHPCYSRQLSVPRWFGRSGIIGLEKIQSYQWFASRQQEVLSYTVREITFTFVITSRRQSSPTIYSNTSSAVSQTFSVSGLLAT